MYYYFRTGSMTLNLANEGASQGESGEGDTVRNVELAFTGEGADTVTGNAAVNRILTSGGDDTIDVSGDPGNVDLVECGAGLDTVTFDADDRVEFQPSSCGAAVRPPVGHSAVRTATGDADRASARAADRRRRSYQRGADRLGRSGAGPGQHGAAAVRDDRAAQEDRLP